MRMTLDQRTEFLTSDTTWSGPDTSGLPVYRLTCPFCGFDYNHEGPPKVLDGDDKYQTKTGVRGNVIVLPFEGECGHVWSLCFGFHKGNIFVFARAHDDARI